jgi:hypothetical protein
MRVWVLERARLRGRATRRLRLGGIFIHYDDAGVDADTDADAGENGAATPQQQQMSEALQRRR